MNTGRARRRIPGPRALGALPAVARAAYCAAALNLAAAFALVLLLAPACRRPAARPRCAWPISPGTSARGARAGWCGTRRRSRCSPSTLASPGAGAAGADSLRPRPALRRGGARRRTSPPRPFSWAPAFAALTPLAFETAEPLLDVLTGYLGNGLYTVARAAADLGRGRPATAVPAAALLARLVRRAGAQRGLAAAFGQRPVLEHRRADVRLVLWTGLIGRWLSRPPPDAGGYGVFGRLLARELLDAAAAHLVSSRPRRRASGARLPRPRRRGPHRAARPRPDGPELHRRAAADCRTSALRRPGTCSRACRSTCPRP